MLVYVWLFSADPACFCLGAQQNTGILIQSLPVWCLNCSFSPFILLCILIIYNEYSYLIWQVSKYSEINLENRDNKYTMRNMGLLLLSLWVVRYIVQVFLHRQQELKTYSFFYFKEKLWSSCNHLSPGRPFKKNKIPRDEGQFKRLRSNIFVYLCEKKWLIFYLNLIFFSALQRP